jgi:hypothetical protein
MYPQCKFRVVKAAVRYYASQLDQNQGERTKKCLEILKFSMGNTIVSFLDKYYKCGVDPDPDRRGLTIGGFESAFLADLEASYIFDKLRHIWERDVRFLGTYRNDKIIVFNGQKSNEWLLNWLRIFQGEVDRLLGTSDTVYNGDLATRQDIIIFTRVRSNNQRYWHFPPCQYQWK